jgi:hypothetical protein
MARDHHPADDPDWLPDDVVEAINNERTMVFPTETKAQSARRIFQEGAPGAAAAIVHIAMYGSNERLRLDAAKYISDRVLGRPGDDLGQGEETPLDAMIKNMNAAAEAFANSNKDGK